MGLAVTILSLLVAIYAVTPRERQLELRFRFGGFERSVLLIGVFALVYLEYYELFAGQGWAPSSGTWPRGITPANVKPLVILARPAGQLPHAERT